MACPIPKGGHKKCRRLGIKASLLHITPAVQLSKQQLIIAHICFQWTDEECTTFQFLHCQSPDTWTRNLSTFTRNNKTLTLTDNNNIQQVLSSSWDGRPFGCNRHGPKRGGGCCAPFGGGEAGSHVTQCGLDRGLPLYQVASWSIQSLGHNRHGPKIGGCAPLAESCESYVPRYG